MRHLNHDAGAVAGFGVGARRAAVSEPDEDFYPSLYDAMRALALYVGDQSDAAGFMLERRMV